MPDSQAPKGLRFSERKLWEQRADDEPVRRVLERMASERNALVEVVPAEQLERVEVERDEAIQSCERIEAQREEARQGEDELKAGYEGRAKALVDALREEAATCRDRSINHGTVFADLLLREAAALDHAADRAEGASAAAIQKAEETDA